MNISCVSTIWRSLYCREVVPGNERKMIGGVRLEEVDHTEVLYMVSASHTINIHTTFVNV